MAYRIAPGVKILKVFALAALAISLVDIRVATASTPFAVKSLVLYQTNDVLVARLGKDAAPIARYVMQIAAHEAAVFAKATHHPGISGAIVMAIKPGRQSRAWLVLGSNSLPTPLALQVKAEAEAVLPISVRIGPVAVAILFDAWGGGQPVTDSAHPVPVPQEWRESSSPELLPDGPLSRIWP